jgi:hypothetical protein
MFEEAQLTSSIGAATGGDMLDVEEATLEADDMPDKRVEHSPKLSLT